MTNYSTSIYGPAARAISFKNPTSVEQIDRALELGKKIGLILGRNVKVTDIPEGFEIMFEGDVWELEAQDLINGLETYGAYVYIGTTLSEKATSTILRHKCCAVFPRQMYSRCELSLNYPTEDRSHRAAYFLKQNDCPERRALDCRIPGEKNITRRSGISRTIWTSRSSASRARRSWRSSIKTDFKCSNDNREGEDCSRSCPRCVPCCERRRLDQ